MTDLNRLSRRHLLRSTAGGLCGLGLGAALDPLAWGAPAKPTPKDLSRRIVQLETTAPAGTSSDDAKLDKHGQALMKLLVHKTRSAFAVAAANPSGKFAKGSLHAAAAAGIAAMSSQRASRVRASLGGLLSASEVVRASSLGPYKDAGLAAATVKAGTDLELTRVLRELPIKSGTTQAPNTDKAQDKAEPKCTRFEFQLNSVKCKVKNDSWVSGADELLIGGTLLHRTKVSTIDRIKYEGFESGDKRYKDYEPCAAYSRDLVDSNPFLSDACPHGGPGDLYAGRKIIGADLEGPGTYALVLVVGEQDIGGGFTQLIADVYDALSREIQAALDDLGIAVGALLSTYLGPIGEFLGVVLGKALGAFFGWLINEVINNQDDYIGSWTWTIELTERTQSYLATRWDDPLPTPKGTWASDMKKFEFRGKDKDDGDYVLRLHFRAFA
ncbi:MAG: hypothetical protein K1X88_14340 [Nannocystaceae bacterium]|nr:hypothetical protein [Nannocystaceae bacterium]